MRVSGFVVGALGLASLAAALQQDFDAAGMFASAMLLALGVVLLRRGVARKMEALEPAALRLAVREGQADPLSSFPESAPAEHDDRRRDEELVPEDEMLESDLRINYDCQSCGARNEAGRKICGYCDSPLEIIS